jgi:hypothetical protein
MVVALPGEETEIVAHQMGGQSEQTPTRALCRPTPIGLADTSEHLEQA